MEAVQIHPSLSISRVSSSPRFGLDRRCSSSHFVKIPLLNARKKVKIVIFKPLFLINFFLIRACNIHDDGNASISLKECQMHSKNQKGKKKKSCHFKLIRLDLFILSIYGEKYDLSYIIA